jgi:redox-sensitive bicupin YhaK (pirin superfamily)
MPAQEPILGDKRTCDALDLIIVPRVRDLGGGFSVHRALPHARRQMVGPFIFFDQMGPVQLIAGRGMDVRPHPHIGLATVTYLFDGRVMHRDSEGNALEITPGAMNLMSAGRGIAHSERSPLSARRGTEGIFGIQSWIALPQAHEETDPSFQHFDATSLPTFEDAGVRARVIAGSAFDRTSPVGLLSEWFYAEVSLAAGAKAPLDPDHEERAIYVVEGELDIAGETFEGPRLLVFHPGDRITVRATRPARLMFLGGSALEGPRYIGWNFVSSRRERIEQAKEDWKTGRFTPVPGETEFIPLPDS